MQFDEETIQFDEETKQFDSQKGSRVRQCFHRDSEKVKSGICEVNEPISEGLLFSRERKLFKTP
jgi:hypothetical protein